MKPQDLLNNPAHKALWNKALEGFKYISGRGWEQRANYEHFWPLCEHLYKLAYGDKAKLPDELKGSLAFMLAGHSGRVRKGIRERPYFHHILMVVYLCWLLDMPLEYQLAAIHHDDVEDVPKNLRIPVIQVVRMITFLAGNEALNVVTNLTNDHSAPSKHEGQVKKMGIIPFLDACLKLLDRTCNLFDMRRDKPDGFTPARIEQECINALELAEAMPKKAPDTILALLHFAIEQLRQENVAA